MTTHTRPSEFRDSLSPIWEIILANTVMSSEIPSPTGDEGDLAQYLFDRFTEAGLNYVSIDEAGNTAGILSGKTDRNILVTAHIDKIWERTADHTLKSVHADVISGLGVADNSLGVAVLASLPQILQTLDVQLDANLILLGTTQSLGLGDLRGIRFFVENFKEPILAGLCLEGIDLGRLSYSSLGMIRGRIEVKMTKPSDRPWHDGGAGVIGPLASIIKAMQQIERPENPRTSIFLGSVAAGSGYNVSPLGGTLLFEARSESEEVVGKIERQIQEIVSEIAASESCDINFSLIARRRPGDIGFLHPLVKAAREIMASLGVKPLITPSISELSALLDCKIPSLTLGITTGENRNTEEELIHVGGISSGIAQIVATLEFIDQSLLNPLS